MKLLGVVITFLAATAWAGPARKAKPDKFARAAGELFNMATAAEDVNDLKKAAELYKKSLQLVVHPSTIYNLASVLERSHEMYEALIDYELYLELDPTATDAAAVRAHVAELEKRPAKLQFEGGEESDPKEMYVLVDGAIVKRPGDLVRKGTEKVRFELALAGGSHDVDIVTPVGYQGGASSFTAGANFNERLEAPFPHTGNLAFASPHDFTVGPFDNYTNASSHGRITIPPGKQALAVHDGDRECAPILVDAPNNDDTLFIYIKQVGPDDVGATSCRKHDVVQVRLKF
ncbi:MAG TPA: tetratricopeptide repeat protein [Kofleriaceae bacterium]